MKHEVRKFCRQKTLAHPLLAVGGLPENPTLSTKKEKFGGEKFKNNSRDGFSGWTRASFAGTGVGAELTSFARNRFELWHKMPPFWEKNGMSGALRRFFFSPFTVDSIT